MPAMDPDRYPFRVASATVDDGDAIPCPLYAIIHVESVPARFGDRLRIWYVEVRGSG